MANKVETKTKTNQISSYFGILHEQYEWLRKEAFESHQSMSSLIREAIELLKKTKK